MSIPLFPLPVIEGLENLFATTGFEASGDSFHDNNEDDGTGGIGITSDFLDFDGTVDMLEDTALSMANGQPIDFSQMSDLLKDAMNAFQVDTTELGDHDVGKPCELDIETEEQHNISETGGHGVTRTENMDDENPSTSQKARSVLPQTCPFSFSGQIFDIQCQKLILNVWDFFKRLNKNPDLLNEIRAPQERAAAALHISPRSIGKIGKNFKCNGKLTTTDKKRKKKKPVVDSVSPEQEEVIRGIIKEFMEHGVTPTLPTILNECRERINFRGSFTSFHTVLCRMGLKGITLKLRKKQRLVSKLKATSAATASSSHSEERRSLINVSSQHSKIFEPVSFTFP